MAGSYLKISLPPGVFKNGTEYEAAGRWYDANLFRWHEGAAGPIGGWRPRVPTSPALVGKARAVQTWKDNGGIAHIAVGTESHLYAIARDGTVSDITPSGYTPGRADATTGAGYGAGLYGVGAYGTPRPDTSQTIDATVWTLDTEGQNLVGCNADDGKIYEWALNPGVHAAQVANSPTARAVMITAERIMVALGANGNPRLVQWADQEDDTDWTPSATNQAGQFPLQTSGRLMCGKRIQGGALLFTDVDVWLMNYVGFPLVYGFDKAGDSCGIISQQGAAVLDSRAVWMGRNGFYVYDGSVSPLPCDVSDYVFPNLNLAQSSKVHAFNNSLFSEVWWFYPSNASNEIDSYVVWNYRENHWNIGSMVRLSGSDRSVLSYPILVGNDGIVYEHEVGLNYDGMTPRVRSGPIELGDGDNIMSVRKVVPDTKSVGDVNIRFYVRDYPDDTEYVRGPYPMSYQTDTRFSARQVEVEFQGAAMTAWRIGTPRLELVQGGKR